MKRAGFNLLRLAAPATAGLAGLGWPAYTEPTEPPAGWLSALERRLAQQEVLIEQLQDKIAEDDERNEETKALRLIKKAAAQHGLDIAGGKIRRSSSRLCLGVAGGEPEPGITPGVGGARGLQRHPALRSGHRPVHMAGIQTQQQRQGDWSAGGRPSPESGSAIQLQLPGAGGELADGRGALDRDCASLSLDLSQNHRRARCPSGRPG